MNKIVAEFGYALVAFLLTERFENAHLRVERAAPKESLYHLLIPAAPASTPFHPSAAIVVRVRGRWSETIPPELEVLRKHETELSARGLDMWIAFVKFNLQNETLATDVSLIRASALDDRNDFTSVTRTRGRIKEIVTSKLVEKADLRFTTSSL